MISAQLASSLPADAVVFGPDLRAPSELLIPHGEESVAAALATAGFTFADGTWARVGEGTVQALRVRRHPHHDEIAADCLVRGDGTRVPAPRHVLLLCAERLVTDAGIEAEAIAALARSVIAAHDDAWRGALKRGLDWGLWRALAHLDRAVAGGSVTPADRAHARRELDAARGASTLRPAVAPGVIALSGVDGAGKSTQARLLWEALEAAGVPSAVEWTRVAADRRLDVIAAPVIAVARRVVKRHRAAPSVSPGATPGARDEEHQPDLGRSLREKHRVIGTVWAYVVITLAVRAHRSSTSLHRRQGRHVIRDRYLVDAVAQLRDDYGVRCGGWARALLARLTPRPLAAFLLLVTPEEALARKHEQYDLADLERLTGRYVQSAEELGVGIVDGARPVEDIAAELFLAVWQRLGQSTPASRSRATG